MLIPSPQAEALGIGPSSLELDLPMNGSNSTTFYFDSDGVTGELIIGNEDLPFRIEPSSVNMSKEDNCKPIELTFYGNDTLEPGVYKGMVTFIAYTGGFVAVGIKIGTKINLLEVQEDEPETPVEEEPKAETEQESEPEAETESESEEEPETESEHEVEVGENIDIVLEEETESSIDYAPYVMGVAAVAALVSVVIWWKRR